MFSSPIRGATLAVILLLVPACMHVPEQPLDPEALLASVRREREAAPSTDPLTLTAAVERMRRSNPAIREARAAWRAAQAVAKVRTPPPNPTLALGPLLLGGTDILSSAAPGIEAALGWAVPLSNARVLNDDLNRVRAEHAFAEAAAIERETYLALRRDMTIAVLQRESAGTQQTLSEAGRAAVQVGRDLANAGQATAVDVQLLDLDAERAHAAALAADGEATAKRYAFAARIGMDGEHLVLVGSDQLPILPAAPPAIVDLEKAAVASHPRLAVLRAAYLVAEKELRIQVADAMPDFEMGLGFENEAGDLKLGLPFSLELPLWDRNQQGIVAACAARSHVRVRYMAALQRLMADIASARAALLARVQAHEALASHVRPASQRTLQVARDSLEAGAVDALRYLEVLRAEREVTRDVLDARIAVYAAWADLEAAAGAPLLHFPDDTAPAPAPDSPVQEGN